MKKRLTCIAMSPEKLFLVKLMLSCFSLAVAITLYLIGLINFVCLIMVLAGVLWNFFAKINSFVGFGLCLVTCFICGLECISIGLYSHAILYLIFYIALELFVLVLNLKGNTVFVRYKNLSPTDSYYIVLSILLFAVCGFSISLCQNNMIVPAIDAVCASLLALSAYLHSRNFREYYVIRPIALVLTIAMFAYIVSIGMASSVTISLLLLYVIYFVLDAVEHIFLIQSKFKVRHSLRNVFADESIVDEVEIVPEKTEEQTNEQKPKKKGRGKDVLA